MEVREASAGYLVAADRCVPLGYKQTEVGVIPEDWEPVPMKALGTFSKGQGIRKDEAASGDLPCVRYGEIYTHHNDIIRSFNSRISVEVAKTSKRLKKGDLLFAGSGETKEEIGKCVAFIGDEEAYAGGDIVILRPNTGDPRFFGYLFNAPVVISQKASKGQGDAVVHVSATALSSIIIPLPSTKAEQKAIAEALSDADILIESLEQLLAKKRHIKQGAMQELLTGKKRLPDFSGKWGVKEIGQFTDCTAGGTPSTMVSEYWGGEIRWMSSGELNLKIVAEVDGRITDEGLRNSSTKMLPANCVLIGLAGQGKTRGTVAMNLIPLCTNQSIAAIFLNSSFVPEYLYHNLDSRYDELRELSAGGGGRGGLNLTIIRRMTVPFPSLEEQTAIATILSDMGAEIAALEEKLAKTRAIKQGMIQELLTGRIRLV